MATSRDSLRSRILSAKVPAVAITGPASSGKTSLALELYETFTDADRRPHCLAILPNATAVARFRQTLLERNDRGVLLEPQVMTFGGLVARILVDGDRDAPLLSPLRRRLLLRRITAMLHEQGKLRVLGRVADTPGLILALDRAIAELKRAAVEPESLATVLRNAQPKSLDLLDIYRCYQAEMLQRRQYDPEGQAWEARDLLAATPADAPLPGLSDVEAVVVDGFTDFTPTQLEILRYFSERIPPVTITLPYADDARDRMWHWTRRALNRLRGEFGDRLLELPASPIGDTYKPFPDNIFQLDLQPDRPLPEGLEVIAAAGSEAEIAAVARRVKRRLLDGTPAGRIAVLARSIESCRPLIDRIFADHAIPIAPAPSLLSELPPVRFLLRVARLAPQFNHRDVLSVVSSSYFRPSALGGFSLRDVATAQMLIREGNVLEGRDAYAAAAERLAARIDDANSEDDEPAVRLGALRRSRDELARAGAMLDALFKQCAAVRHAADLGRLIESLQLTQAAAAGSDPSTVARDLRALGQLLTTLAELGDDPPSLGEFEEALGALACPAARGEALVDVLDVLDARPLRWDHVFLIDLNEGRFPQPARESSLITEADRQSWASRGIRLDTRGDLTAREMLLFYLAVMRADCSVTLSYLESDAHGRAAAPSIFLTTLLEPFGGLDAVRASDRFERISPGSFLPPREQVATLHDATNAAAAGLFSPEFEPAPECLAPAASHRGDALGRLAAGLIARRRRWTPSACDAFDGRLSDGRIIERLAERFRNAQVFSASALNAYGQCPWQFFARYVMGLEPLSEPQRRLEPVDRGSFVHNVLFRVVSTLRADAGCRAEAPLHLVNVDAEHMQAALADAVERESAIVESRNPPYPTLWEIQRNELHAELANYLEQQRDKPHASPLRVELGFGIRRIDPEHQDPHSRMDPVTIDTPSGPVRLRGKIDRIDRIDTEDGPALLVVDYKTGSLPSARDINEGRNLQLPVYVDAVEQLLDAPCAGGAFHSIRHGKDRHFSKLKPPRGEKREFDERRDAARETIGRFIDAMASGRFDAMPTHDCPAWCAFRQICHFSQARLQVKQPPEATP